MVVETDARSIRVLTETGQVGLRPNMEAVILTVETGLVLVHREIFVPVCRHGRRFAEVRWQAGDVADAPGRRRRKSGERDAVNLQQQLSQPKAELEVRTTINNIQSSILTEITDDRRRRASNPGGSLMNPAKQRNSHPTNES